MKILMILILFTFTSDLYSVMNVSKSSKNLIDDEIRLKTDLAEEYKYFEGCYFKDGILYALGKEKFTLPVSDIIKIQRKSSYATYGFFAGYIVFGVGYGLYEINNSGGGALAKVVVVSLIPGIIGSILGSTKVKWVDVRLSKYKTKDVSINFTPTYFPVSKNIGFTFNVEF